MYLIKNIINIEKKKIFSKIKFLKFEKIFFKILIKGGGCNGFKFNFIKIKNFIKKNEILIVNKKLKFIINFLIFNFLLNSIFIKKNKNFLIKNKFIKNFCNCGESFNLKI